MKITKDELKTYRYSKIYDYEGNLIQVNIIKDDKRIDQVKSKRFSLIKYLEKQGITVDENEEFNTDILRLAMIYNVDFPVVYTMTAPYTHEYCISSYKCHYIRKAYCEPVTAKDWYNELPTVLYKYMLKNHPNFDYKELLEEIKLAIKNNEIKDVNGSTYRGQPTSDEVLQKLKYELVNHLPLSKNIFMSYIPEEHQQIKEDFEKLYDKYLKEV